MKSTFVQVVKTFVSEQYAARSGGNRYGELIINNNNVATGSGVDTSISSSVTDTIVGSVTLTASKAGKLTIDAGQTLTILGTSGALTVGTGTTLTNNGTLKLTRANGSTWSNSNVALSAANTPTLQLNAAAAPATR